jgi:serine/threonine-protein kinase
MTPDLWQRVERLYHLALEQPAEWRAGFLEHACGGDEALRAELESLLSASEGDEGYLETPALAVAAQAQARYDACSNLAGSVVAKHELESSATARGAMAAHPSRLGRYRITGQLGAGGMGIVYRGIDPVIDRAVAIKTILHDSLGSPAEASKLTERLKREARAAGSLTHPNIVTVFDAGEEQGFTYIVMELIPGSTLDAVLEAAGKRLPAHRALEILKQAAVALDFAHSHGVVHRDVKPSNIMVQQDGAVKLTDFGIARRTTHASVTLTGRVAGSPNFMSPEQLRGQDAGPRSDQYSLAVVAWILLTGSVPFDHDDMLPLIEKILGQEPPLCGHLSRAADAVLRRALAKDPAARFESCDSFVAALRVACASPAFPQGTPAIPQGRPSKRGQMAASGLLAACLLAGAGVVWKLRMEPSTTVGEEQKSAAIAPAQVAPLRPTEKAPAKSDPVAPATPPAPAKSMAKVAAPASGTDKNPHAAAAPPSGKPGATKINSVDGLTYVWIQPGAFSMGCSPGDGECMEDEKPAHPVTISTGFWIGQTEVTEEAYRKVTGKGGGIPRRSTRPVNGVTWEEAQGYCEAAGMRLPTEAEWEYATRAGSTASRYGELDRVAWYDGNSDLESHDVAGKEPNAWGLYDMLGNVWEWAADWYGRYQSGAVTNPQGPSEGPFRMRRGGGSRVGARAARASYRVKNAHNPHYSAGFRCVGN